MQKELTRCQRFAGDQFQRQKGIAKGHGAVSQGSTIPVAGDKRGQRQVDLINQSFLQGRIVKPGAALNQQRLNLFCAEKIEGCRQGETTGALWQNNDPGLVLQPFLCYCYKS